MKGQASTMMLGMLILGGGMLAGNVQAQTDVWSTEILYSTATNCGSSGLNCSDYTNKQASANANHDQRPQMNDVADVVWQGRPSGGVFDQFEIYYRSSATGITEQITDNGFADERPRINNSSDIAWMGFNGSDWDVFNYTGGQITNLSLANPDNDCFPKLNNVGEVAWIASAYDCNSYYAMNFEIYTFEAGVTAKLDTPLSTNDIQVRINDSGDLLWRGLAEQSYDIFTRTDGEIVRLSDDDLQEWMPDMNNNGDLTWAIFDGEQCDIVVKYAADANPTQIVTTNATTDDHTPQISDNGDITWMGFDGEDWEIYLYSNGEVTQLTDNAYHDIDPQINAAGDITWLAYGGDIGIYLYQAAEQKISKLSDADSVGHYDSVPDINGEGTVVWTGFDGNDFEIIIASPPGSIHDDLYFKSDVLNLRSKKKHFTSFIDLPAPHSAADIDPASVAITMISPINSTSAPLPEPLYADGKSKVGDFDHNGVADIRVQFDRRQLVDLIKPLGTGQMSISLVGNLYDGASFTGERELLVVDKMMTEAKKRRYPIRKLDSSKRGK